MTSGIQGKSILITGAFGALGSATAIAAAKGGARVALIDRAREPPPGLLESCGGEVLSIGEIDLTLASDAAVAVESVHVGRGGIDVLIVILFLASDEAQPITGALLPVTGRT